MQVHSRGCTLACGGGYREWDEPETRNIHIRWTYGVRFIPDKVVVPVTCSIDETISDPFGSLDTVHKH